MVKCSHSVVIVAELRFYTRNRRSLKRLVKANHRKSVQQLTSMFNEDHKKISARTMLRELKEMSLKSFVSTRKPARVQQTFWPGSVINNNNLV